MAVSLSLDSRPSSGSKSHPDQRQNPRDTKRRVSADINSSDLGPLRFREPPTLEVADPIGRHCALLDKYEYPVVTHDCWLIVACTE